MMSAQGTREGQGHAGSSAAEDCGGASLNSLHLDAVQHPPQGPRQSVVVLLLGLVPMKAVVMVVWLCWRCHGLLGFGFVQSRKEGQEPPHPFHTSSYTGITEMQPCLGPSLRITRRLSPPRCARLVLPSVLTPSSFLPPSPSQTHPAPPPPRALPAFTAPWRPPPCTAPPPLPPPLAPASLPCRYVACV